MKIKEEVKNLCIEFINENIGSERWEEIHRILEIKYGFTAFDLLALFRKSPIIEYTTENINLIMEVNNG